MLYNGSMSHTWIPRTCESNAACTSYKRYLEKIKGFMHASNDKTWAFVQGLNYLST